MENYKNIPVAFEEIDKNLKRWKTNIVEIRNLYLFNQGKSGDVGFEEIKKLF